MGSGGIGAGLGLVALSTTSTSSVAPLFTGTNADITISNVSLNGNVTQQDLDIKPMSLSVNVFI